MLIMSEHDMTESERKKYAFEFIAARKNYIFIKV